MINKLYIKFDFISWMEHNNIPVYYSGANVGKGWVGTDCPFCYGGDTGGHLGINKKTKVISCWRCHTVGNIITLIQKFHPDTPLKTILAKYQTHLEILDTTPDKKVYGNSCKLPKNAVPEILKPHGEYLQARNFSPRNLYEMYNLHSVGIDAHWKFRIIIPIFSNRKLMSFTGRDVTGNAKVRYKACPLELSVLDPKSIIYDLDRVEQRLILVEGATDVWRVGAGCGAVMGSDLSSPQLAAILQKKFQKVFILFDNDTTGEREGARIGSTLSQYVDTEIITLPSDVTDPGNLSTEDVKVLRKQVFGKIY